eukprot:scaffold260589_cov36-Tisochrysis_lutea.AAC.2
MQHVGSHTARAAPHVCVPDRIYHSVKEKSLLPHSRREAGCWCYSPLPAPIPNRPQAKTIVYSLGDGQHAPTAPPFLPTAVTTPQRGRPKPPEPERTQASAPPDQDVDIAHSTPSSTPPHQPQKQGTGASPIYCLFLRRQPDPEHSSAGPTSLEPPLTQGVGSSGGVDRARARY